MEKGITESAPPPKDSSTYRIWAVNFNVLRMFRQEHHDRPPSCATAPGNYGSGFAEPSTVVAWRSTERRAVTYCLFNLVGETGDEVKEGGKKAGIVRGYRKASV